MNLDELSKIKSFKLNDWQLNGDYEDKRSRSHIQFWSGIPSETDQFSNLNIGHIDLVEFRFDITKNKITMISFIAGWTFSGVWAPDASLIENVNELTQEEQDSYFEEQQKITINNPAFDLK